jgi:uncharacterized protein (DUF169 family)
VPSPDWRQLADALTQVIGLEALPIAITFAAERPESVPAFDASMPPPTPDGRTGRISAGCVFWMRAAERTFSTAPEDHFNCSVGSLTQRKSPATAMSPRCWNRGEVAASVGCQLSRVRTGMSNREMTCAIPGARSPRW